MSVYLVVDITIHDPEHYAEYARQVPVFIRKYGGRYRVRGGAMEVLEGNWRPGRLVVLEFPSREDALGFLGDPEYREVAAIRHAAADTSLVLVDAYDPGPDR